MSRVNGEKARANIARKRRTAQRQKDRTILAGLKQGGAAAAAPAPKEPKAKEAKPAKS